MASSEHDNRLDSRSTQRRHRRLVLDGSALVRSGAAAKRQAEARDLYPELDLLRFGQSHVLLVGPRPFTDRLLDAMWSVLRQPVVDGVADGASWPREGTLILRNAASLNQRRQRALSTWIETTAARVVTICDESLYARVIAGTFSSTLYYRLNTLRLVATPRARLPSDAWIVAPTGPIGRGPIGVRSNVE